MASLTVISLGHVERHRAERSTKLVREVPIIASDASNDGSEDSDGFDSEFEDLKRREGRFGLHAPPSERSMTASHWLLADSVRRRRASFALGLASQSAPPPDSASASDPASDSASASASDSHSASDPASDLGQSCRRGSPWRTPDALGFKGLLASRAGMSRASVGGADASNANDEHDPLDPRRRRCLHRGLRRAGGRGRRSRTRLGRQHHDGRWKWVRNVGGIGHRNIDRKR
jgi:hypothetical protein